MGNKIKKDFRLDPDVVGLLQMTAIRENRTATSIVEEAIKEYCFNLPDMKRDLALLEEAIEEYARNLPDILKDIALLKEEVAQRKDG